MKKEIKKDSLETRRIFDESIRKQVVNDIEKGKCTVLQASRELGVHFQTIYNWLYKYSRHLKKNNVLIVEEKSEAYRTKELEKRIKDLEAALGRKSLEIEYLEKIIDLANKDLSTDLKKNIGPKLFVDSIKTEGKKDTK